MNLFKIRNIINRIRKKVTPKKMLFSIAISLFLVVADYWVQNITFPLFDDVNLLAWVDQLVGSNKDYFSDEDVTYINLSKDKALVPIATEWGDTIGNDVITDREALSQFLTLAAKSRYRYIFIDVRFEEGYNTPFDSILFDQIKKMPNLIIATHRKDCNYTIADSSLLPKTAFADFRGTVFSGFSRYEFIQDGQPSVALRMLNDIDHKDIKKHWYGYKCDRLCYNLGYIPLPNNLYELSDEDIMDNTAVYSLRYPYLGSFILKNTMYSNEEIIHNLLDDKIVILGDFDNDKPTTYIGEIPGPIISLAAYKYLHNGNHEINRGYMVFLLLFYWGIAIVMLTIQNVANLFKVNTVSNLVLTFLGIGTAFFISKIVVYVIASISMVVLVPTFVYHIVGNRAKIKKLWQLIVSFFRNLIRHNRHNKVIINKI